MREKIGWYASWKASDVLTFKYTFGKSSNRSPEMFSILAKLSNMQKFPPFGRKVLYIRSEYLIVKLSQLRWRENDGSVVSASMARKWWVSCLSFDGEKTNDGYPYSVISHLIIPFIWIKTGNNSKDITFHTFFSKNSVYETPKLTFWVMNDVLSN